MYFYCFLFYCFLNFFTPKLYRFPHKKMNSTSCSENLSNSAMRTLKATWLIHLRQLLRALFLQTLSWRHKLEAISEKINKQLWFQLHYDTVFVLLKCSQNTQKPMSDILEKSLFGISQDSAVTYFRWDGQVCNLLVCRFLGTPYTKNYWNRSTFDRAILKNKKVAGFLGHSLFIIQTSLIFRLLFTPMWGVAESSHEHHRNPRQEV